MAYNAHRIMHTRHVLDGRVVYSQKADDDDDDDDEGK